MLTRICCLRLTTAGVIIGWTNTAISILSVILYVLALFRINILAKHVCQHMKDQTLDQASVASGLTIIISVYICFYVISMIGAALLILGTVKENHLLLLPWLIYNWCSIAMSAIYYVYYFFVSCTIDDVPHLTLILSCFSIVLQCFWWYIILSLYKRIQDEQEVDIVIGSDISYHDTLSEKSCP